MKNLRMYLTTALMLAIGLIMHSFVPGTLGAMKFDFTLGFIFIAFFLYPNKENAIAVGIAGGLLTALTTTFPGGQLPNIIDKIVTVFVLYLLYKLTEKIMNKKIQVIFLSFIGTIVSGIVFLGSALVITGLPAPFTALFLMVVLPTAIGNIPLTFIVYTAANRAKNQINPQKS